ncbi:MAG: MEDS domain-containing protein [Anaerolineae bacterium]
MAHAQRSTLAAASPLGGLRPGDHVVFLYETEEEHRDLLTSFLREGLARGEKVIYLTDAHTEETLLDYLREGGVNPDPYLTRGQLVFLTARDVYLEGGSFDPERMIARLDALTQEALAEGYTALRETGEMTWALQGLPGSERLREYEARLEAFFRKGTCIGLCQYDRRRFDAETLLEVVRLHPLVAFREDVRVSTSLLGRAEAEWELERQRNWWRALAEAARLLALPLDQAEALARIISLAREVAGADYAAIALVGEDGQVQEAATSLPGVPVLAGAIRKEGLTSWIVRTGQALIVDDVDPEGRIVPHPGEGAPETANPAVVAAGIRSAVGLPLVVRARALGVLYFYSLRPGALREVAPALRGFADGVAMALENARLCREAQEELARRHQAEERLRESEARYRAIVEQSVSGLVLTDGQGLVAEWNPALEEMTGLPRAAVMGRPIWEVHADLAGDRARAEGITERVRKVVESLFRQGDAPWLHRRMERVIHRPDGTRRVLSSEYFPVRVGGNLFLGGFFQDVTERYEAERARRESEARYRALAESSEDMILLLNREGRILYANSTTARELGRPLEEILGQPVAEFLPLAEPQAPYVHVQRAFDQGTSLHLDHQLSLGDKVWLNTWLVPIRDAGGRIYGVLNVYRDITERKRLEEQLQQAVKMEAIGRLAGGVAHDFNNLLTAIGGYAHLLRESLGKDDPRRRDVEEILAATDRAASLTRQLLAFSRRQVLRLEVLNLNAVILEVEKMLRRLIGEDIALVTALAEDLGYVEADRSQIEQVILNLVVNAREAMPRGGTLTIETANVFLDDAYARQHVEVKPGPYVLLAVTDTGIGMDAKVLRHIFEPFFTTKETGTGLGLSTVYGIVKQSGGHIWVYSEPGQGTTFKIYLPQVEKPARPAPQPPVITGLPHGTETVLVVEDAEAVREFAARVLRELGYTVLTATSGAEALRVAEGYDGPIHLLLTDVVMPGMNGQALQERLTERRPGLKVLYMSGYTENAIVLQGVLKPGTPYIQKPFTPRDLARRVRQVLDTGL